MPTNGLPPRHRTDHKIPWYQLSLNCNFWNWFNFPYLGVGLSSIPSILPCFLLHRLFHKFFEWILLMEPFGLGAVPTSSEAQTKFWSGTAEAKREKSFKTKSEWKKRLLWGWGPLFVIFLTHALLLHNWNI